MVGGLAVISDVPKTLVYELSRVANRRRPGAIPEGVFTKPPSQKAVTNATTIDRI
jgi:NH3-dependent NAD+ synthetase